MIGQLGARAASTAAGLVMAAAAAGVANRSALVVAGLAAVAVLIGIQIRSAATFAVLLAVSAVAVSGAPLLLAAVSGLSAAAYLVLRHAVGAPGLDSLTQPTVVGASGFAVVGLAATAFPLQLPWLPVVAPIAVFAIFTLVTRPFWTAGRERR
ncbi:MAG: hypothetical protein JO152_13830 [Mycobacteriaceae bacterium]|nr:hypothetical protein [Mycobacteriaceae bacterium]